MMKKLMVSCLLSVLFLSTGYSQYATERTGYEGDYFSLEGALDLFKQSYTLRDFERKLNTEDNWVNNLDLNYDGRIDYIRVRHKRQGNFHAIILQALVDRYDVQDVAVIEIDIVGRRDAILQIVGDEDIYGEEVIVEPVEGYSDRSRGYRSNDGSYVNVYYWKPVQYMLDQQYSVYNSPYRWQYYPTWWSPWSQYSWSVYRPRIVVYHRYYTVVHRHRVVRVHNFYRPYRSYSYNVTQRANKVRVTHGKQPVHRSRPDVNQDRRSNDSRSRDKIVERSRTNTPSSSPRQNPSEGRKRTTPYSNQNEIKSRTPQTDQRPSNPAHNPRVRRSTTPSQKPSVNSNRSGSASNPKAGSRTNPQIKQPSRSTTTPSRRPSASSRQAAPASKSKATRSTTTKSSSKSKKRGNL